jgi:hypothetical protein
MTGSFYYAISSVSILSIIFNLLLCFVIYKTPKLLQKRFAIGWAALIGSGIIWSTGSVFFAITSQTVSQYKCNQMGLFTVLNYLCSLCIQLVMAFDRLCAVVFAKKLAKSTYMGVLFTSGTLLLVPLIVIEPRFQVTVSNVCVIDLSDDRFIEFFLSVCYIVSIVMIFSYSWIFIKTMRLHTISKIQQQNVDPSDIRKRASIASNAHTVFKESRPACIDSIPNLSREGCFSVVGSVPTVNGERRHSTLSTVLHTVHQSIIHLTKYSTSSSASTATAQRNSSATVAKSQKSLRDEQLLNSSLERLVFHRCLYIVGSFLLTFAPSMLLLTYERAIDTIIDPVFEYVVFTIAAFNPLLNSILIATTVEFKEPITKIFRTVKQSFR